jgi:hypothetical protein
MERKTSDRPFDSSQDKQDKQGSLGATANRALGRLRDSKRGSGRSRLETGPGVGRHARAAKRALSPVNERRRGFGLAR